MLAGCAGPLSTLEPEGPAAAAQATLWWIMLFGSVALFALVIVPLALTYLKPGLLSSITTRQWIIGGGLLLPVPVLVALTGTALVLGEQLLPQRDETALVIEARPERWSWRFVYPETGAETINVLHLPAGRPVEFEVHGSDVIHSFWVPRLGGKVDAIPRHVNRIRLLADEPGSYWGICAEYCGEGHDGMRFRVIAHDEADYVTALEDAR